MSFRDCQTQKDDELNNAIVSIARWKMLVSDWSSVCVSTFIGRGVSGWVSGGTGGLSTVHSKVGEENQEDVKGKDPTVIRSQVNK